MGVHPRKSVSSTHQRRPYLPDRFYMAANEPLSLIEDRSPAHAGRKANFLGFANAGEMNFLGSWSQNTCLVRGQEDDPGVPRARAPDPAASSHTHRARWI